MLFCLKCTTKKIFGPILCPWLTAFDQTLHFVKLFSSVFKQQLVSGPDFSDFSVQAERVGFEPTLLTIKPDIEDLPFLPISQCFLLLLTEDIAEVDQPSSSGCGSWKVSLGKIFSSESTHGQTGQLRIHRRAELTAPDYGNLDVGQGELLFYY